MRNLVVLAVVILTTASTFAETYTNVFFDANKTLVLNSNELDGIGIEVRDLKGKVLQTENFSSDQLLSRKNLLKNLPNGKYELIVSSNSKKAVYPISVTFEGIKMISDSKSVIFKPVVTYENNLIEFSQLSLGRNITFTLSDKEGVFYTKSYKNEASINANFSVAELPSGDYTITIVGNNQNDTFNFKK